jgi:hypothetical protein
VSDAPAPTNRTDYFNALIRSSSLRIGNAPAVPDERRASPDDLVEIIAEREASAPAVAVEQRESVASVDRRGEAAIDVPEQAQRRVPVVPNQEQQHRTARSTPAPATSIAADSTRSVIPAQAAVSTDGHVPDPVLDPVRLAMTWVAADPEARAERRQTSRSAAPQESTTPHLASRRDEPMVLEEIEARPSRVATAGVVRPRPAAGQPAARAIAAPSRPPSQDAATPAVDERVRHSTAAVEELVEISIGAINLHVEGPPRQTVIQSPPASRPQPAPAPRRERSGLERRYLRSF